MKTKSHPFLILFLLTVHVFYSQTATVRGIVFDSSNTPIENVLVIASTNTSETNANGFYEITIPADKTITIRFTHISFKEIILTIQLENGEDVEFNPIMETQIKQIGEMVVFSERKKTVEGIQHIAPDIVRTIPGANAGVENILKSLPGVNSNNELSTQYAVRGGNYDENLIYVNEVEIYRPFLIRSGQQEGMSFINTDLIENINFSAGGFQAKYGDKLSSVLDVTYKTPSTFTGGVDASFLGGSVYLGTASKNTRFTSLSGLRYRNNSLLVNSKNTKTNYNPIFADAQTFLTYRLSDKLQFHFLGNLSLNVYDYQPKTRQTSFGTLNNPISVRIDYTGKEEDSYQTAFGAFKGIYQVNQNTSLKFISSLYHTKEKEYYNIIGQYSVGEIDPSMGGLVEEYQNAGRQHEYANNKLNATIFNIQHKGLYNKEKTTIEWGVTYTLENFNDHLEEYEKVEITKVNATDKDASSNWNLPPLHMVNADNKITNNRLMGFAQWSKLLNWRGVNIWLNAGIRGHFWNVSGAGIVSNSQFFVSPRAQIAVKPNWKKDMLFRLAGGLYQQPPFYREMRDNTGHVNPLVKAQKSYHIVLGHDYSFKLWNRPFKLVSEAYYKYLDDVNPYTLENVRIRYEATNDAVAYAYGLDLRLNGAFIPNTESWFSFGYLKTEENRNHRGYIPRPTDQRLKFAVLFQDYIPSIPNVKLYLNGVYSTGLPGGSPNYADPYNYQLRLPDYKRMDVGVNYTLLDRKQKGKKGKQRNNLEEVHVGFEIFNIFDIQNSITNTWVNDYYTNRQYAVPNYMTGRIFNIKAGLTF